MSQSGTPLVWMYDSRLVALSIFIAISASYGALDLGARVTAARGWIRSVWVVGGATAMGLGIWSMHFTGMLAFPFANPSGLPLADRSRISSGRHFWLRPSRFTW